MRVLLAAFGLAGFLSGCATFASLDLPQRMPAFADPPVPMLYRDLRGAVHVHSRYSHDSKGTFDDIVRAARKARLDFVVVTDHNTLQGLREKMDGFYGNTLVLIGTEISTGAGHLLALGISEDPDRNQDPSEILRRIAAEGGLSFIAHGEDKKKRWADWSVAPLTGMEIYSLSSDVRADGYLAVGLGAIALPPRLFFRSVFDKPEALLRRWDELLRERRLVGLGSLDAHAKVRLLGRPIDDYSTMFRVVQTHVWASEPSKGAVLEALKQGHVYVGFDLVAPIRNFLLWAESPEGVALMGDEVKFEKDLKLKVFVPRSGDIRLIKDGTLVEKKKGKFMETSVTSAGVFRVEVYRRRKLWILSNPLYVRS